MVFFGQPKIQSSYGVHNAGIQYYTIIRYIVLEIYFLMASNPDRITPGRRLPEATQSILHHYFIRSYTDTNTYLLIIDKFLLIRYQATVKQSTLIFADGS